MRTGIIAVRHSTEINMLRRVTFCDEVRGDVVEEALLTFCWGELQEIMHWGTKG